MIHIFPFFDPNRRLRLHGFDRLPLDAFCLEYVLLPFLKTVFCYGKKKTCLVHFFYSLEHFQILKTVFCYEKKNMFVPVSYYEKHMEENTLSTKFKEQ